MRLKKRNDCSLGKSCIGRAGIRGGGVDGGGALSAAVSCRVSRLWLNPRRLIFQQKYRGSAKGRDESAEESLVRSEGEMCCF